MKASSSLLLAVAIIVGLISCGKHVYKDYPIVQPISYNFLQVDGDQTRIGINGPAALAGIATPRDEQVIVLTGEPIASFEDALGREQRNLGNTDTIVEVTGLVPRKGGEARLQFRLVALSLAGSFADPTGRQWRVNVSLSEKREQPQSIAVVTNDGKGAKGGAFDSKLQLFPRFVFTSGDEVKVVDDPDRLGFEFVATDARWSSVSPRDAARADLSGGFFALTAKHGGEAGQHATKVATIAAGPF